MAVGVLSPSPAAPGPFVNGKWWWILVVFTAVYTSHAITSHHMLDLTAELFGAGIVAYSMKGTNWVFVISGMLCSLDAVLKALPLLHLTVKRVHWDICIGVGWRESMVQTTPEMSQICRLLDPAGGWLFYMRCASVMASPMFASWGALLAKEGYQILAFGLEENERKRWYSRDQYS